MSAGLSKLTRVSATYAQSKLAQVSNIRAELAQISAKFVHRRGALTYVANKSISREERSLIVQSAYFETRVGRAGLAREERRNWVRQAKIGGLEISSLRLVLTDTVVSIDTYRSIL